MDLSFLPKEQGTDIHYQASLQKGDAAFLLYRHHLSDLNNLVKGLVLQVQQVHPDGLTRLPLLHTHRHMLLLQIPTH